LLELGKSGYQIHRNLEYPEVLGALIPGLVESAKSASIEIQSCAEPIDLSSYGVLPGKCIDDAYIEKYLGIQVSASKDSRQRPFCGCVKSRDIGQYHSCSLGCKYCYAK
jgi:hypothetical protein